MKRSQSLLGVRRDNCFRPTRQNMAYSKKRCSLWLRIVCQMDVSQKTETSPGISNRENLIEGIFYNSYGITEKINRMRQQLSHQWQQEGRDDWGLPEPRAGAMWQGTSLGVTAWQAYGLQKTQQPGRSYSHRRQRKHSPFWNIIWIKIPSHPYLPLVPSVSQI